MKGHDTDAFQRPHSGCDQEDARMQRRLGENTDRREAGGKASAVVKGDENQQGHTADKADGFKNLTRFGSFVGRGEKGQEATGLKPG